MLTNIVKATLLGQAVLACILFPFVVLAFFAGTYTGEPVTMQLLLVEFGLVPFSVLLGCVMR